MKITTKDNLIATAMIGAVCAMMLGVFAKAQSESQEQSWEACVNEVAMEAYVDLDVGNTFDSGFDVGLHTAEQCGGLK